MLHTNSDINLGRRCTSLSPFFICMENRECVLHFFLIILLVDHKRKSIQLNAKPNERRHDNNSEYSNNNKQKILETEAR